MRPKLEHEQLASQAVAYNWTDHSGPLPKSPLTKQDRKFLRQVQKELGTTVCAAAVRLLLDARRTQDVPR